MLYFHIPYCRQKCHYCAFHFSVNMAGSGQMHRAMLAELERESGFLDGRNISSIYFGGGTPSLIEPEKIGELLLKARGLFSVSPDAEITLEANPEDLSGDKLKKYLEMGINRLSVGCQSFNDDVLVSMNRTHRAEDTIKGIRLAQDLGFGNISLDLIYGIPAQDDKAWKGDLQTAFELNVQHISAYALTVEEASALAYFIKNKKTSAVNEDDMERQFRIMQQLMSENGFRHYEISNFSKKGFHSRHNSSYWTGRAYLGIGPSAHSFDGKNLRRWNFSSNAKYTYAILNGNRAFECETLDEKDRFNEKIMLGLRTRNGICLSAFGGAEKKHINKMAKKYIETGLLETDGDYLRLTGDGILFADGIASDFFLS